MNKSDKKIMIGSIIVTFIIIVIMLSLYFFNNTVTNSIEKSTFNSLSDTLAQSGTNLEATISSHFDNMETFSKQITISEDIHSKTTIKNLKKFSNGSDYIDVSIIDVKTNRSISSGGVTIENMNSSILQKNLKINPRYIALHNESSEKDTAILDLSIPIYDDAKDIIGIFNATYLLTNFNQIFPHNLLAGNCFFYVCTYDGKVIMESQKAPLLDNDNDFFAFLNKATISLGPDISQFKQAIADNNMGNIKYSIDGVVKYLSFKPIKNINWFVVAVATEQTVSSQANIIRNAANILTFSIIILFLMAVLFIYIRQHRSTKHLEYLKKAYTTALLESNDLLFESEISIDSFVIHSKAWKNSYYGFIPHTFSKTIVETAEAAYPEFKNMILKQTSLAYIADEVKRGNNAVRFEYQVRIKGDIDRWFSVMIIPILANSGNIERLIFCANDVTELKAKQQEIMKAAQRDGLSQLYNKVTTETLIDDYFIDEGKDGVHAMLIVDIDNFKSINDNLGHSMGDDVIVEVSSKLKKLFRASDIVGRIGGDEFMVLIKNATDPKLVENKLIDIGNAFRNTYYKDGKPYNISSSIGVAFYRKDGATFDELYHNADKALYISKKSGKDSYTYFNPLS